MAERRTVVVGTEGRAWLKMTIDWDSIPIESRKALNAELDAFTSACKSVGEVLPPVHVADRLASFTVRATWLIGRLTLTDPSAFDVALSVFRTQSQIAKLIDRDELTKVVERCPELEPACARLRDSVTRLREKQLADMAQTFLKGAPISIEFRGLRAQSARAVERERSGPTMER